MEYISKSVEETQKIAQNLAKEIANSEPKKGASIIAFEGELGAGKTTFIQAFAKTLGIKQNLTSPTFVILKPYALPAEGGQCPNPKTLIHIDAYRINDSNDLLMLGVGEMISNPENIILIEWSERIIDILPPDHTKIHIDHIDENTRKIIIK